MPQDDVGAERFRRAYYGKTFWCGILLGGCGRELADKIYRDRVCHFAHHPPVDCRRARGHASAEDADHLFIAQAFKEWFGTQGLFTHPKPEFVHDANGRMCGVVVRLHAGRGEVRIQLTKDWASKAGTVRTKQSPSEKTIDEWLYVPKTELADRAVRHDGYALRVRCRTVGWSREVEIGTALPEKGVEWSPLTACSIADRRIQTPILESLGGRAALLTQRRATTPDHESGEHSLAQAHTARTVEHLRARRQVHNALFMEASYTIDKLAIARRSGSEQRVDRLQAKAREQIARLPILSAEVMSLRSTLYGPRGLRPRPEAPIYEPITDIPLPEIERILRQEAKARRIRTWTSLALQLWLPLVLEDEQSLLFAALDRPRMPDGPILSALIVGSDHGVRPTFRNSLSDLGFVAPTEPHALNKVWRRELEIAYFDFGSRRGGGRPRRLATRR